MLSKGFDRKVNVLIKKIECKNFCKITFSTKVLKWQKCDMRTSYVTLEKLRTFPQKIHKFSYVKLRFLA